MKLQTSSFCGAGPPQAFCKGKDKAWIVLTMCEMVKIFMIMLAVLVMSTATVSYAQKAVPAGEIIAKVQNNQPVNYEGVIISGDLDLGRLNPAEVHSEFSIVNSTVKNSSLNGVSFEKDVSFRGTTFSNASFEESQFQKDTSFNSARFLGDADLNYTNFWYYIYFSGRGS